MSDLINHLRSDHEAVKRRAYQARRPREMYNTLYFSNNIDVRICPKNGCSSLKLLYGNLYYPHAEDGKRHNRVMDTMRRKAAFEKLLSNSDISIEYNSFQLRPNSIKIAVLRDPVERAVSAIKYGYNKNLGIKNPSYKQIVDSLDAMELRDDSHFFSQTFYLGSYDQYDKVYQLKDLNKLIDYLLKESSDFTDEYQWYSKNVSTCTITAKDLPSHTVKRIESLYIMDYENGWCCDADQD